MSIVSNNKLNHHILNIAIASCTSLELDLLLYITKIQNEFGNVRGLYYRDVCAAINTTKPSYYNALYSLESKGIIIIDWLSQWGEKNVTIINNIYLSDNDRKENPYIGTNQDFLYSEKFMSSKLNVKRLTLMLLKVMRSGEKFAISKDKLKLWVNVQKNGLVEKYIENLKEWFVISIKGDIYYISLPETVPNETQKDNYLIHKIKRYCRLYNVSYEHSDLRDVLVMFAQWKDRYYSSFLRAISTVTIKYRTLNPRLINHLTTINV